MLQTKEQADVNNQAVDIDAPRFTCQQRAKLWFVSLSRRSILALAAASVIFAAVSSLPAVAAAPEDSVDRLHATLISIMQQGGTVAARAETLQPVLDELFDFPTMTRVAVGSGWRGLDADGQRAMVDQFAVFTGANYASNFKRFNGERFEILGSEDTDSGRKKVEAQLVKSDGGTVAFEYLLQDNDGWRIIDVIVDGSISELARRRSEFSSLQRDGGTDAVRSAMADRTAELLR